MTTLIFGGYAIRFLALAFLLFFCGAVSSAAKPFEEAIELWLSGDDSQSLPKLSKLAAEGHTFARLLIARIETNDLGLSPYRKSLKHGASRELFRKMEDGGRFGQTWISVVAQDGNELAIALLQSTKPEPKLDLVRRLHRLGEHQATDYPTRIIALYGKNEMRAELLEDPALLPELRPYLKFLMVKPEPKGDGLAALRHILPKQAGSMSVNDADTLGMAGLMALGFGFGDQRAGNRWRPSVERWLLKSPSMRPYAGLCDISFPTETGSCAFAMFALAGGYYEAVRIDTPLESVISQERYLASPRAQQTVLRRAALARTETNLDWLGTSDEVAEISQCAADLIAKERGKYLP